MDITLVQHTLATSVTGTSISKAYASNNTLGNCLVLVAVDGNGVSTNPFTPSDTLGNTYTLAKFIGSGSIFNDIAIYVVPNCMGGANTVTVTNTTTVNMQIAISEWSGLAPVSVVDQTNGNGQQAGANGIVTVNSITPTQNNELIIAAAAMGGADTITGETLTVLENNSPDGKEDCCVQYSIQVGLTTVGASWTDNQGASAIAAMAIVSLFPFSLGSVGGAGQNDITGGVRIT